MQVDHMPVFSIVIATYNAAAVLPECLDSLASQQFRDFEVVMQDNASIDGTGDCAAQYASLLSFFSFESAPDSGLYDAWNRALPRCRGKWILFLGADDTLYDADALARLEPLVVQAGPAIRYIASACIRVDMRGEPFACDEPGQGSLADMPQGMAIPHSALLHRRDLFENNCFDTSLRIAGDYDFVARTMNIENSVFFSQPLVRCRVGGLGGSLRNFWERELEFVHVSRKYYPRSRRWKLYARLMRAWGYRFLARFFSEKTMGQTADVWRLLTGRRKLWSLGVDGKKI